MNSDPNLCAQGCAAGWGAKLLSDFRRSATGISVSGTDFSNHGRTFHPAGLAFKHPLNEKKKSGAWPTAYISFCYAKKPLTSPMKLSTDNGEITSAHSMAWAGMGWRNMGWSGMGCLPHFCRLIGVWSMLCYASTQEL